MKHDSKRLSLTDQIVIIVISKKDYYETAKDISKTRSIMLSFIEKTAKRYLQI